MKIIAETVVNPRVVAHLLHRKLKVNDITTSHYSYTDCYGM